MFLQFNSTFSLDTPRWTNVNEAPSLERLLTLTWSCMCQPQSQTCIAALAWHYDKYNGTGWLFSDCFTPFETKVGLCHFEFMENMCWSHHYEEISLATLFLGTSILVLKKEQLEAETDWWREIFIHLMPGNRFVSTDSR